MQRRSQDFDMAGARWNNSSYHVSDISFSTPKCDEMNVDNQKSQLPINHTFYAHETFQGDKSIMNEMMSCRREPNLPNFPSSLHLSASQETHLLKFPTASVGRHLESSENKVQPTEDCPKSSPTNPKKRRKV